MVSSLFPVTAVHYPKDSIRVERVARANAWIQRLETTPGADLVERQLVAFAQLAMIAEQDTMAKRLFDARLAQLRNGAPVLSGERSAAVERSLTLAAAIDEFADPLQDSARRERNVSIAKVYVAQLLAIPRNGYHTRSDSTIVLYRQFQSLVSLMRAANAAHDTQEVFEHSEHALAMIPAFGSGERTEVLTDFYPYKMMATLLAAQVNGRAKLDAFNTRLLALAAPRESEFSASLPEEERRARRQREQSTMRELIASFAMIGKPAPQIHAHAYFNTPDSLYHSTPRAKSFNDGVLRVMLFGRVEYGNIAILQRIQDHFGGRVQAIFYTNTDGYVGPDIKTPSEEAAWLRNFYENIRHVTIPVALWAGEKVPGRLMNTSRLTPSMVYDDYHSSVLRGASIIIDGDGIIRGYEELRTREDEAHAIDLLTRILAERHPATAAVQ